MVYGLAADLHFHNWSAFATVTPEGQNSRLVGLLSELRRCAKETREAGGLSVVLAGDIFHVRGSVSPSVLNAVKDELRTCNAEYDIEFIILAGNHDLEGKDATRLGSAITALEEDYVRVFNEPTGLGSIVVVPWYESVSELKDVLTTWAGMKGAVEHRDLILHAPIDGVIDGLPAHGLTGEWLAGLGFKRVFAGHYHNHRQVYDGGEVCAAGGAGLACKVYSIGALAHHSWSDIGSRAGFMLVHDDRVEWRKSHLPEFLDIERLADYDEDELPLRLQGNFVRARIEAATTKEVESLRAELEGYGVAGCLIQAMPVPPKREDSAVVSSAAAGASLETSVGDYILSLKEATDALRAELIKESLSVLSASDEVTA